MRGQPGIGVMLHMLSDNTETVNAVRSSIGKTIHGLRITENRLRINLDDNTVLSIWDNGQSCCEIRWMYTDDDLYSFIGSKLLDVELADGGDYPAKGEGASEYGLDVLESQFLNVKTTSGVFTVVNYVDHNGYYGGFAICAELSS